MIIDNPDALKSWLTVILQPLCDADPSALARYVFALLKKEKPIKELKKSMNEQLDVFLADETRPFVERLFTAIASKEYLVPIPPTEIKPENDEKAEVEDVTVANDKAIRECTPPLQQPQALQQQQPAKAKEKTLTTQSAETNNTTPLTSSAAGTTGISDVNQGTPNTPNTPASSNLISPLSTTTLSISSVKTVVSDKENNPRELRRRRPSLRSRSRSRSPNERNRQRSRSRDRRAQDREKIGRQFRNKSPPLNDRRRGERRGALNNNELSTRDAINKGRTISHSASRSRSPSPEIRKISRSISPAVNENVNTNIIKRQRCRDFDEKGYCVRGETCPWDHGINPVVLEGINNSAALLTMPQHLREYNPDAPELWNRSGGSFSGPRCAFPPIRPPGIGFRPTGPPFPFGINPGVTPLQRELIPVPVVDANSGGDVTMAGNNIHAKRRYEPEDTVAIAEGPIKRKLPINSRLGPRINAGPQQNCSLELRKVPRGMNTIAHLNNHFSKFGKIVNIQITYDGDPEAAIVTFSTHAEANVAYRSTEAVLNNRFIKVFWHSNDGIPGVSTKEEIVTNGRKNSQYHLNNMPTVPVNPAVAVAATESAKTLNVTSAISSQSSTTAGSAAITTSAPTTSAGATATTPAGSTQTTAVITQPSMRLKNNTRPLPAVASLIRKKQEEQAKAVVQLANGLRKRKHELIEEYFKQMKSAVDLLERMDQNDAQRPKMLETIKNLQGNIDKLNKELSTEQEKAAAKIQSTAPPVKKTKEQQKKELLDIELELIAQQQEGNDTSAIQKRLEELQRSLGVSSVSQKSHFTTANMGATRINHRLRTAPAGSSKVDRRPKTIVITGFVSEDSDLLLGHFKHFGEITKHEIDKVTPSIKISYATRVIAEQAAIRGRIFKEKQLQISWLVPPLLVNQTIQQSKQQQSPVQQKQQQQSQQQQPNNENNNSIANEKTSETVKMETDALPELRLEDEEEEDESEDRSWRR